jgi:VCBS repeat-containing protein
VLRLSATDSQLSTNDTVTVTVQGDPTNKAIDFGGTNAFVTFGAAPRLGASTFTLETWFRRDGAGVATFTGTTGITAIPLVTKGMAELDGSNVDMNYFLGIRQSDNVLVADFEDMATGGNHPVAGTTAIVANGAWHHAAASYDGTTWRLYLDGALQTQLVVGAFTPRFDSIQHAALGTALNSTGGVGTQTQGFFDGALDEARIWNYARSPQQVSHGRQLAIATPTPGLLGRWGFNEGTGATLGDTSGAGITGTVVGTYTWVAGVPFTNPGNTSPAATADAATAVEETATTVSVLGNDTDADGDALTLTTVGVPGHGTAKTNANGTVTYTPETDYNGTDTFTYGISDGQGGTATGTVTMTVTGTNDAPKAVNDSFNGTEDTPLVIAAPGILANDTDVDGDTLRARLITNASHGTVALTGDGGFTYTPAANFNGVDSFTYKANDGVADSQTATVTIVVAPQNDAPVAAADSYGTDEDTTLTVDTPGVLANDSDLEGDNLSVTPTGSPAHGSLTLNADGSFRYVPNANFHGADSFTYIANDGVADSNEVTVTLAVASVNDAPVAADDAVTTDEDTVLTIAVLTNDSDVDGDSLTATLVTSPLHGTLTTNADGTFGYMPVADYNGSDSFSYKANDGKLDSAAATVTITINPVNDPPLSVDDSYGTSEDVTLNVAAPGVLGNDTDLENGVLTAILVAAPGHGTVTVNPDGGFAYVPAADFNGIDRFTYKVGDSGVESAPATVTITVAAVNDAPVARADEFSVNEDATLAIPAQGVLANDSDVDSDSGDIVVLSAALVSGPRHGTLSLNTDGSFSYSPEADFNGTDGFTYKTSDGLLDSNTAAVTITVTPVNDAPAAVADSYNVAEDVVLIAPAPGVLGNDTDRDGDPLSAVLVTGPAHGEFTLNADGSFRYTPAANYNGPDSFSYRVSDGVAESNTVTVALSVTAVNDAPVALNDTYGVDEDATLTVNAKGVLANDTDAEGDSLVAILVTGPAHGTFTSNADGSFSYSPDANYNGTDSFTYKANDGSADSNVATVTITVGGSNDPPVANDDRFSTNEDTALTVGAAGVLANDTDPDGDALTVIVVVQPQHGTLAPNANGSFVYTPSANYNGVDGFTYMANDGVANSNVATVTIAVAAVNDAPVAGDNSYTVTEDTARTVLAPGVLANDSDADGDPMTAIVVRDPAHGTLALDLNGGFVYRPDANYNGPDSFAYKTTDGTADSNIATVLLTVRPVNDAPVAGNDSYATDEDTPLTVAAPGVLVNDSDIDSTALTAVKVTNPAHGRVTLNADGSFVYTPYANYHGPDSFTYRARDAAVGSNTATVNITVRSVADAPVALGQSLTLNEDRSRDITLTATDGDNEALTFAIVTGPQHGTLTGAGSVWTYRPNANYNGPDSFTFKANDGVFNSNIATVNLAIAPVNDAPVAQAGTVTTLRNRAVSGRLVAIDVDGDVLSYSITSLPTRGTVTVNSATGAFIYTPALGKTGTDSFKFKAYDGKVFSDAAKITVSVQ